MFNKIGFGLVACIALGSISIDASQPARRARTTASRVEVPDFGDPYMVGSQRYDRLCDGIRMLVGEPGFVFDNATIDALKKHLAQCDYLDISLVVEERTYTLKQVGSPQAINVTITLQCQGKAIFQEIKDFQEPFDAALDSYRQNAKSLKEAIESVQAHRWTRLCDETVSEADLLTAIYESLSLKDEALFEGRCAYIKHWCSKKSFDLAKPTSDQPGATSISEQLSPTAARHAMLNKVRVDKLKKAIKLDVSDEDLDFTTDDDLLAGSSRRWRLPFSFNAKMRNILLGSFGAVALVAIASAVWYKVSGGKKREAIVRGKA